MALEHKKTFFYLHQIVDYLMQIIFGNLFLMGKHCRGQRILININNETVHFNVNSSNSR